MSRELVIERTPFGIRSGLLENGRLLEVTLADDGAADLQGNVYLGRVRTVDQGLGAAFVDCGLGEDAYLGARDARLPGAPRDAPIARQLSEGQEILVQVRRDAAGGKRPRLTTDIALVGLGLVYRPRQRGANLSARLARSAAAAAQRARARALFPQGGITLRLTAPGACDAALVAEAARLEHQWASIQTAAKAARPPACIHALKPLHRLLLEQLMPDLGGIVVADQATLARVRAWLAECQPAMVERLACVAEPFEATGAAAQLEAAFRPAVPLAAGGALIIEPTAALTAIDVDGAGREALEVNLDASREIARQLRLRRIGGTIVVDFIDLPSWPKRARVVEVLRQALADDPAPVQVFPPSPLGLVEISRKRTGPSLAEMLGRRCPTCGGAGMIVGLRRRADQLMTQLAGRRGGVLVHVAPDLDEFLRGAGAPAWQNFLDGHGSVALEVDRALGPGDHRIEGRAE